MVHPVSTGALQDVSSSRVHQVVSTLPRDTGARRVLFGRHEEKMALMSADGGVETVESSDAAAQHHENAFDVVIEATGNPSESRVCVCVCVCACM